MAILSRLNELLAASFNALLDRIEDPERMLQQVIERMEEVLAAAERQAARAIAAERRLHRELEEHLALAERWQARARLAIGAGRDDLARPAVTRKLEHDDICSRLRRQHNDALQSSNELKAALRALRSRIVEARQRQRLLFAQRQAAQARVEVQRALGPASLDMTDVLTKLSRLENRMIDDIENLNAQAAIIQLDGDRHDDLVQLEEKQRIEEALNLLRSSLT